MYTADHLKRFPFFKKLLETHEIEEITDSLTGVLARPFLLNFVHYLIGSGTPFTFAMLDLDNFKFVNDTYGRHVGDEVLQSVASDLVRYMGNFGVVGRFGGDEFLIVNLVDHTYTEKKAFFTGMYDNYRVLRKNPKLPDCDPFITGTIGAATFPTDAQDYDSLFALIDKTLYRGKSKGRNCYIIYVAEKHKDIEIRKIGRHGLYDTFHDITDQLDRVSDLKEKLRIVFTTLQEDMRITDLYYTGKDRILRSVCDPTLREHVPDIDELVTEDLVPGNSVAELEKKAPALFRALHGRDIGSILIVRIGMREEHYGYLMCAEPHAMRIWQEDDCATLFFLAREIAWAMRESGQESFE